MENANLIDKLYSRLAPHEREALDGATRLANEAGLPLYLAGGSVRDLLLDWPGQDLDLVVEGDAPALARRVAQALGARCLVHAAFGTATVKARDLTLDIATARAETYSRPGALPAVRLATIAQDLARRDFTVNAMALALAAPARGQLLDPKAGREDLQRHLIRILHEGSFVDDATRILRALRYEARLGFRIDERTLALLRRDVGYLASISGARLRDELLRILQEPAAAQALHRGQALGVLAAIHPALTFDEDLASAFKAAREDEVESLPLVYLALLASRWSKDEADGVTRRLALTKAQREAAAAMPALRELSPALAEPRLSPSTVVDLLAPFPLPSVCAFSLVAGPIADSQARRYLLEWRYVKPALDGTALQALGVPPGPEMGKLLQRLRAAKLDGVVKTREDEVALVQGALAAQTAKR